MMKNKIKGFTFVELIVVITIMAILATIGFTMYQSYLSFSRDSNRIIQLSDINDGLEVLGTQMKLPFPDDMIELTLSGASFAYQGNAGENVVRAIGYDGGGIDLEYGIPFSYMLSKNLSDFQLLGFIKDAKLLSGQSQAYAKNIIYEELFPKVVGSRLGISIEKYSQIPLHLASELVVGGKYDIISGTGTIISYLSDTENIDSSITGINYILPNNSCKRILELGNAKGDGIYTISPDGVKTVQVYCDMTTDGGGWTLIARSVSNYTGTDTSFGWLVKRGSATDNTQPYSFGEDVKEVVFSELLMAIYNSGMTMTLPARKILLDRQALLNNVTTSQLYAPGCISNDIVTCRVGNFYWGNIANTANQKYFFGKQDFFHYGLGYKVLSGETSDLYNGKAGMLFIR